MQELGWLTGKPRLGQNVARQCALGAGLPVTTVWEPFKKKKKKRQQ